MDTQTDSKIDTRTDSKIRLLLRILRNPIVNLLVFYYLMSKARDIGFAHLLSPEIAPNQVQSLIGGVLIVANLLLVYFSWGHFVERRRISELALPPLGREIGIGLLLGFGLMTTCVLIAIAFGVYRIEGLNWQNLVAGVTGFVLLVPISEELIFRGVVFRILEGVFGGWLALALSSVVFGLIHMGNEGESLAGIAGIVCVYGPMLAAPYMLTRHMWVGFGLHAAWNYTMGKVYSVNISGAEAEGLFKASLTGPELLTGGSAGMEGSLIGIVVGITFTVVTLILAVRRGTIVPPSWKHKAGSGVR
ncbi:lysostaphin resistance A-like protein [Pantanalinema sp. GBBB05]|uniref:CPBP family intramembrane glutamic endopeptidase n=1 Tax=Pantanalinema sp. GBBB05 TaxID=2604139 RepID=UPI001DF3D5A3|nr:CPBP family intramembrane metalloprotease [Pantanalinema sp. GBBB05]